MKIIELRAENFKRLRAIDITPDGHLVEIRGKNGQGKSSVLDGIWALFASAEALPPRPVREVAIRWGVSSGMMQVIGTPEQVAAELEAIWRDTECHGFNLTPTTTPNSVVDFVDQVIPILQSRDEMLAGHHAEAPAQATQRRPDTHRRCQ